MQPNKIVVHYKDGRIAKGSTNDFSPDKKSFHIVLLNRQMQEVEVEHLKALFFVKDMEGDKDYEYAYDDLLAGGGKKIRVNFMDGEAMVGYVLGYSPDRPGFLMTPADSKGNNERIYIVKSATKRIEFLTKEEKRNYHRAETVNLVNYGCLQEDGGSFEYGMGTALDISQGGILMETQSPIQSKTVLLTTTDSEENLINIKGKVAYCRKQGPDKYHVGIHFMETTEKVRQVVIEMVKAFLATKTESPDDFYAL